MTMHSETEARKIRCCGPAGCGVWIHVENAPDHPDNGYERFCTASSCMAWRWGEWDDTRDRELYSKATGKKVSGATADDADWRLVDPDEPEPPHLGFCGIAGAPE